MVDIVNALGAGSGIDTQTLVSDLVELNNAPAAARLDKREELLDAQISDYGLLRSALATLESSVAVLGNPDTFNAKSVSVPDTSLIALTNLDASTPPGNYQLKIEQTAQSQSLSTGLIADPTASVGKGTVTIRLGAWDAGLASFTVNNDAPGATLTIDDTNNSLEGLRDAINDADIGVQASVISDGGSYRLLVSGPSGESNEIEITVVEDGAALGLADFEFNESTQVLTQEQEGLNAEIRVNGLLVERSSNTVDDIIDGLEFDIFNSSLTETINITISEDHTLAETAIRDFVAAYNTFLDEVEQLTGFNEELDDFGSLHNDSMAGNLIRTVQTYLGSSVVGINEGFTVLANLGIRTDRDGSLNINENPNEPNTNFTAAMDQHYDLVKQLFIPQLNSDDVSVEVTAFSDQTQSGNYDVVITQQPSKGELIVTDPVLGFPVDTTGKDYSFDIVVDGITASIALPDGVIYNDGDELALEIQSQLNVNAALQEAFVGAAVSFNIGTGGLEFVSDEYGSGTNVSISAIGADTSELGLSVENGSAGTDVGGTVDGAAAFGFGRVLLPALNSDAEGLKMLIQPGASSATLNFSRGFSGDLTGLIDSFLSNNGLISEREDNIADTLDDVEDDRESLERRTEAYRARLKSQFLAMELIVNNLNNTGSFLDGILDRLPFTAQNN